MSLVPFLRDPVMMDPSSDHTMGYIGGEAGSGGVSTQAYTPFLYSGALYMVLQAAGTPSLFTPTGGIYVYQSTDNGATWAPLDAAHGPTRTDGTPCAGFAFDGDHTLVVAFMPTGGSGTAGPINLQNFDLSTGLWGSVYATSGAPSVYSVQQAFVRPDGSILVFATDNFSTGILNGPAINGTRAYVFASSTWSDFAADTNVTFGRISTGNTAAVMDSDGNIHLFMICILPRFPSDEGTDADVEWDYQLVKSDNTLGASAQIQVGGGPSFGTRFNLPGIPAAQPCISGDNVIFPLTQMSPDYATVSVGTPLSAPVWTELASPGIDPHLTLPTDHGRLGAGALAADASGVYMLYFYEGPVDGHDVFRLCRTPNVSAPLTGWGQAITAFDGSLTSVAHSRGWDFLGLLRSGTNCFATAAGNPPGTLGQQTQYWFGRFGGLSIGNDFE